MQDFIIQTCYGMYLLPPIKYTWTFSQKCSCWATDNRKKLHHIHSSLKLNQSYQQHSATDDPSYANNDADNTYATYTRWWHECRSKWWILFMWSCTRSCKNHNNTVLFDTWTVQSSRLSLQDTYRWTSRCFHQRQSCESHRPQYS